MKLKIYTDGACSKTIGGWAFYIPELNIRVANKAINTTNNRMEMIAVIKALEFIQDANLDCSNYEIYSDSMYVIGGINLNWSKEKNDDLWGKLFFYIDLLSDKNIKFIHVKGHNGTPENEECDKLAVMLSKLWTKKNSQIYANEKEIGKMHGRIQNMLLEEIYQILKYMINMVRHLMI